MTNDMGRTRFRLAVRNLSTTPERRDGLADYIYRCTRALEEIQDLSTKHPSERIMKLIEADASAALASAEPWLAAELKK